LLAPACASFDQFRSYEHRGVVFKQIVNQLQARTDMGRQD
jgi:UDP-N-acetylmuramoylalanine--D-glutamate ligase